jgi:hypothetical protein
MKFETPQIWCGGGAGSHIYFPQEQGSPVKPLSNHPVAEVEVEVTSNLRSTVSRPVYISVGLLSGARDQILFSV